MFELKDIHIKGIGGIDELNLKFNKGLNLICGANGIGKTTVLDCIIKFFHHTNVVKRNVKFQYGSCLINYATENFHSEKQYSVYNFTPNDAYTYDSPLGNIQYVINFNSLRTINYTPISSINSDPSKDNNVIGSELASGLTFYEFKNWFINRYLFSHTPKGITPTQQNNFELAMKCFSLLDERISFGEVDQTTFDILVNTPNGQIYFEYLSSGFKSCLYIMHGLIKEIEYRFNNVGGINIQDFNGLILIDELDVHLHPQWQGKLIHILKEILPNAQIIATTHSPHMIQFAERNEIIALGLNKHQQVELRNLPETEYGFQGWSVEEILEDVMGLSETRTPIYLATIKEFEQAINEDDVENVINTYNKLDRLLHPRNPLRKLLRLQVAQFGGEID